MSRDVIEPREGAGEAQEAGTWQRAGSRPMSQRLVASTIANLSLHVVGAVVLVVTTPFIVHRLEADEFGALTLLLSLIQLFSLLDIGLSTALVRFLAPCLHTPGSRDSSQIFGTALTLLIAIGAVVCGCACWQGHRIITGLLHIPEPLQATVHTCFLIACGAFFLRLVAQAHCSIPVAAQRLDITSAINLGSEMVRITGTVAALALGMRLEVVVGFSVVAAVINLGCALVACRRLAPSLSLRPRLSRKHLISLLTYSRHVLIASLGNRISHSVDRLVLAAFLPVASVGYYAIPHSLTIRMWTVLGTIASVVFPAASSLHATHSRRQLLELLWRSNKTLSAIAGFPAIVLLVAGRRLLEIWIGPDLAERGTTVLQLLAVAFFVSAHARIASAMCQAADRPELASRYSTLSSIGHVLLLLLLVPDHGIAGAAWAYLIVQLVAVPVFILATIRSLSGSPVAFLRQACLPLLVPFAISALALILLQPLATSMVSLMLILTACGLAHVLLAFALICDATERRELLCLASRLAPGIPLRIGKPRRHNEV